VAGADPPAPDRQPAIARDDFELIEFEQAGATWGRVDRDFDGLQVDLVAVNEAAAG